MRGASCFETKTTHTRQLHFASGSLKQFLEVTYDEKIKSEDTPADDIEGTLYNFIPADYTKSAVAFDAIVDADAKTFRPLGEKIGSYTRSAVGSNKGKGKANGEDGSAPSEDDENAVVYEMYKVSWSSWRD